MITRNRYWPIDSPATWLMILRWELFEWRDGWHAGEPWWRFWLALPRSVWGRAWDLHAVGVEWTREDAIAPQSSEGGR